MKYQEIIMENEFELCGTHIPLSNIKDYRVMKREYIYRPAYREKQNSIMKLLSGNKYEFSQMLPYAAIISESEYNTALRRTYNNLLPEETKKNIASGVIDAIAGVCFSKANMVKDIAAGTVSAVIDKIPFKKNKRRKYYCVNLSGRVFETYLDDIPAVVTRNDGRIMDVDKNDEIYAKLGDSIKPSILEVSALLIDASQKYLFFGNDIQIHDADHAYQTLKKILEKYRS